MISTATCISRASQYQSFHISFMKMHNFGDVSYLMSGALSSRLTGNSTLQVDWGSHDLVVAARHLLAAALADPNNQRFVLLSESGIPLYPPAAMHLQLLSEDLSRARALLPFVICTLLSFLF